MWVIGCFMKKNDKRTIGSENEKKGFLIFSLDESHYAISASSVLEIIEPLPITPLPFVPDYIDGLINFKGQVIPQLNLGKLLLPTLTSAKENAKELIVIETSRYPCGLKIDELVANVNIDAHQYKPINNNKNTIEKNNEINDFGKNHQSEKYLNLNDFVVGEFEWQEKIVLVFNADYFGEIIDKKQTQKGRQGLLGKVESQNDVKKINTLDCLVIIVGVEKYALLLKDIVEIVHIDSVTNMPGSPDEVKGMTMVRDEALLILSLSNLLSKNCNRENKKNIVIVERNGTSYGLEVDNIEGIISFNPESLRPVEDENAELSGVLIGTDKKIIGLIKPERLINDEQHVLFEAFIPEKKQGVILEAEQYQAVLNVAIGEENYGIPLEHIRHIAEYKQPEKVFAENNKLIVGAVDINGSIIPVVDLAVDNKEAIAEKVIDDKPTRSLAAGYVIVGDEKKKWAITISKANEIIELPIKNIEKVTNSDFSFVIGIANIGNQLISVIDVHAVLNS